MSGGDFESVKEDAWNGPGSVRMPHDVKIAIEVFGAGSRRRIIAVMVDLRTVTVGELAAQMGYPYRFRDDMRFLISCGLIRADLAHTAELTDDVRLIYDSARNAELVDTWVSYVKNVDL